VTVTEPVCCIVGWATGRASSLKNIAGSKSQLGSPFGYPA